MPHPSAIILSLLLSLSLTAPSADRPNFLFIVSDDQSAFDFKLYNPRSALDTPAVDRLAAEGMTFDAAYHMGAWVSGVCTPSRHMIMSGRTVWHIPNRGKGRPPHVNPHAANPELVPPDLAEHTMAAVFNRAGYDTMRTCKRGNSYDAANEYFSVSRIADKPLGTSPEGNAWHGDQVLAYLDERESTEDHDPFLIYFGFSHPHDTRDGTPELLAKYGAVNHADPETFPPANEKQPALPLNYLPAHPFNHGHPESRDENRVSGIWSRRDEVTVRNEIGRYFACSEDIDQQIDRVLTKLEAMGELENTYIFYTSDHGIAIGRHGLQGKQNLYEHSWRVPLIVRGPGITPGTRAPGNVYLLDVLATLCDLADVPAPKTNEGLSFRPVLEGKQRTVRDLLYGLFSGATHPGMRSLRQGDWKLIQYDVMDGTVHETQLFNLANNPLELVKEHHDPAVIARTGNTPAPNQHNLATDPAHAEKLAELQALLLSEMERLDDPFRLWNQKK